MAIKRTQYKCAHCGYWNLERFENTEFCSSKCVYRNQKKELEISKGKIRKVACAHCEKLFESDSRKETILIYKKLPIVCSQQCSDKYLIMHGQKDRIAKVPEKFKPTLESHSEKWLNKKERVVKNPKSHDELNLMMERARVFGKGAYTHMLKGRIWDKI